VTSEQVLAFLGLEEDAMTVMEVKDWISSVWVGRAVQSIPVVKGYHCKHGVFFVQSTERGVIFPSSHIGFQSCDYLPGYSFSFHICGYGSRLGALDYHWRDPGIVEGLNRLICVFTLTHPESTQSKHSPSNHLFA